MKKRSTTIKTEVVNRYVFDTDSDPDLEVSVIVDCDSVDDEVQLVKDVRKALSGFIKCFKDNNLSSFSCEIDIDNI